jgi:anti-sigma factor RsiW
MSCEDARSLLHAYVDGELDLVRSLEIEKHLDGCKTCTQVVQNQQAVTSAMRSSSLYFRPPRELKPRIDAALRRSERRVPWSMMALAASLLIAGVFVDRLVQFGSRSGSNNLVAQEVLDSHLRSLMPGHLADVQSTDRHTVKPWFNGKVDFSPPVADFAEQGFPLIGGRLDSVEGRTVAVLVYQRRQHLINVYVWPSNSVDSATNTTARQGYNMIHWTRGGTTWWLASDMNAAELETLAGLLRQP